ncbi:MAG TPA: hypothetical protein VKB41_16595 [Steroidobacteraceae bacterium]|nr:hypothetical protein [Steroidobacteraceae bacterium]
MSSRVTGLRVAGTIFAIVCIAHIWRLVAHAAILVAGYPIPTWPSILGAIVAGFLSVWMWRLASSPSG